MEIKGHWYPAGSSKRLPAVMTLNRDQFVVAPEGSTSLSGSFAELVVSSRIGNIPRKITLADQSVFDTDENAAVDQWLKTQSGANQGWAHKFESRWSWVVIALVLVVVAGYGGVRWGLPWTSEAIAERIPEPMIDRLSVGSLDLLDRLFFSPSELPEDQQQALVDRFNKRLAGNGDDYVIHFRKLGVPNAMALPSGDLVVTDAFVEMATPEEFDAVMLHEIGHVVERHGMQQVVRSSIVTFAIAMMVGDPSGVEEIIVALPVFLMQSHYSRQHESEADTFAFEQMIDKGIDPVHFATIMEKMSSFVAEDDETETDAAASEGDSSSEVDGVESGALDYLSSHPATKDRIARAREYSEKFNAGQ